MILGGSSAAREALTPLWALFAGVTDAGPQPAQALVLKLLHNQMLLTGQPVVAETIRIGRATVPSSARRAHRDPAPGICLA